MKTMKKVNVKRVASLILAMLMALMYSVPQLQTVEAADPSGGGSEGIVGYYHPRQGDVKYVFPWNGTRPSYAAAGWLGGVEPEPGKQYVYCVNPTRNAMDKESWNQHFRWRFNLNVNRWLLGTNNNQLTNPLPNVDVNAMYDQMKAILYLGHPYNRGSANYDYNATQDAIYALITDGASGSKNDLYNAAMAYTGNINGNVYFYAPDTDTKQIAQNTVGLALWSDSGDTHEPQPPAPAEKKAFVSITAHKTINGEAEGFDTDESKNQFAFRFYLPDGTDDNGNYHTRRFPADMDAENKPGEIAFTELSFSSSDIGKSYTYTAREIKPSEGMTSQGKPMPYDTPGMIYDDTQFSITIEVGGTADDIKLTCNGKDVTNGVIDLGTWDNKVGKLNTTVKADGQEGGHNKAAWVDGAKAANLDTVTDKIDYENLVGGATYKVQGTLMEIGDSKDADKVVAKSTPKDCVADKSGSGSWEIEFTGLKGKLQPGKKYVVYESAQLVKDAQGEDVQDGSTVTHENRDDLSQTVVVGGKLKTTVTAGGKSGSESKAATLTADEAAAVKDVTDKIDYEGLTAGATYNVSGTLHDVTDNKDVATATEEKKAEKADGTWDITFKNVSLKPGHKYVVYEEAVNKDDKNDKAEHKDDNDLAQTVVVQPEGNEKAVLAISKTSDVKSASVGDTIPYIITVKNTGEGDAKGVKIRDTMNKNLEYVSDDSDGRHSGQTVDWTVDVPAGEELEIEINCRIKEGAEGQVINNVKILNPEFFGSVTEDADQALVGLDDDGTSGSDTGDDEAGDGDSGDTVTTGDVNNVVSWILLAAIAALLMVAMRKRNGLR